MANTPAIDMDRVVKLLSPKQIRSIAYSNNRINIWSGAIRSGKTVASLIKWMLFLASPECPTNGRIVMVGQTSQTIARNVFSVLQDPVIFGPLASEVQYTPGAPTATILGRVIDIIGAHDARSERRLRGLTCAAAYIDEATLVPQEFWTQLLGRCSVRGARLYATTNPDNPAHWLRKDFILRKGTPGIDLSHWHFTLDDNPGLPEETVRAYKAEFVGLWYRRFILGHWVAAEGAIYDMFDETIHVVDDAQMPAITRWLAVGVDYGTTNPFAAVSVGLGADQCLYVTSEYYYSSKLAHRSKTDGEYSQDLRHWIKTQPIPGTGDKARRIPQQRGITPSYTCVDPSAKSFIVQLFRDRHNPTPARNSVNDGIRTVATLMAQNKLKFHRSAKHLIDETPGYSWDDEKALKGIDEPVKTEDHALDALRYAIYTTEAIWRPHVRLDELQAA